MNLKHTDVPYTMVCQLLPLLWHVLNVCVNTSSTLHTEVVANVENLARKYISDSYQKPGEAESLLSTIMVFLNVTLCSLVDGYPHF